MVNPTVLAPGARIVLRDSEWLIRKTLKAAAGSRVVIEVVGISDFIKHEIAQFIADLEEDLIVLDPKETKLVIDDSSGYLKSLPAFLTKNAIAINRSLAKSRFDPDVCSITSNNSLLFEFQSASKSIKV